MKDTTKGNSDETGADEREDVSLLREDGNVSLDTESIAIDIRENRVYLIGMLVKVYMRERRCLSAGDRKGVVNDTIRCIYLFMVVCRNYILLYN